MRFQCRIRAGEGTPFLMLGVCGCWRGDGQARPSQQRGRGSPNQRELVGELQLPYWGMLKPMWGIFWIPFGRVQRVLILGATDSDPERQGRDQSAYIQQKMGQYALPSQLAFSTQLLSLSLSVADILPPARCSPPAPCLNALLPPPTLAPLPPPLPAALALALALSPVLVHPTPLDLGSPRPTVHGDRSRGGRRVGPLNGRVRLLWRTA